MGVGCMVGKRLKKGSLSNDGSCDGGGNEGHSDV